MTRRRVLAALLLVLAVAWAGPVHAEEADLFVSTAVSLKEPLLAAFEEYAGGDFGNRGIPPPMRIYTGGSGILAQQILRGAPSDLFLSASSREIERLQDAGLVGSDGTCALAGNTLVVVTPLDGQRLDGLHHLADARFQRVGVANPRTAPLGRYARQALESANLAARLEDKLIPAEHARQVIDYVSRGEVDVAIVYATDAQRFADRVSIALEIDPNLHQPIVYWAALLEDEPARFWARRLFEFLCSDAGRARFAESGLTPWPGQR